MAEDTVEPVKKGRGWPKGKPRGPRKPAGAPPTFTSAPEPEAPIHVRLRLKNYSEVVEFGAGGHTVDGGFHVFTYAAKGDPYRTTRREFAISEIVEIEITLPRTAYYSREPETIQTYQGTPGPTVTVSAVPGTGPKIHSARQNAANVLQALEQASGSIKMDKMPNLAFGDSEA